MKIYIATTSKLKETAQLITAKLHSQGHQVFNPCEELLGRPMFYWPRLLVEGEADLENYDIKILLKKENIQRAFQKDKKWLDWADCCILTIPSGRLSHMKAGYAKGCGKSLFVLGEFKEELDIMHNLADGIYELTEMDLLLQTLERGSGC